jgi:2'-5' RNA ligase
MADRLFVAVEIPEPLCDELAALDPGLRRVRWLRADQMHLTLAFLGDVGEARREALEERLAEVEVARFVIPVAGVGTFGRARPKVVWAGVGRGHPHLFALHKRVHDAALAAGIGLEPRPFRPHITLGRSSGASAESFKPFLRALADAEFGFVAVERFALVSSTPGPGGSEYRCLRRWALAD